MSTPQHVENAERLAAQIREIDNDIQRAIEGRETSGAYVCMLRNEQWKLIAQYNASKQEGRE